MMDQDVKEKRLIGPEERNLRPTETRIATKAILRQLQTKKAAIQLHGRSKLNQKEVGQFLAEHAKLMFLAASAADLPAFEKKAELLFYEAYALACGAPGDAKAIAAHNGATIAAD